MDSLTKEKIVFETMGCTLLIMCTPNVPCSEANLVLRENYKKKTKGKQKAVC